MDGNTSNNRIENLRPVTHLHNSHNRKMYVTNSSGCTGVSHNRDEYWRARWFDENSAERCKNFSIAIYGEDRAFKLACEYRAKMIQELNLRGYAYTERHGNA